MSSNKCCVGDCNSTSETHKLFSFPKKDSLRNLWLSFLVPINPLLGDLSKEQVLREHVCIKHFDSQQFDEEGNILRFSYPCLLTYEEMARGEPLPSAGTEESALSDHNYYREQRDDDVGDLVIDMAEAATSAKSSNSSIKIEDPAISSMPSCSSNIKIEVPITSDHTVASVPAKPNTTVTITKQEVTEQVETSKNVLSDSNHDTRDERCADTKSQMFSQTKYDPNKKFEECLPERTVTIVIEPMRTENNEYKSKYNLSHMRTQAGGYTCMFCQYKCDKENEFISHMRKHISEKRFRCDLCQYVCDRKSNLEKHKRTHTGEKPFNCDMCEYKSSDKSLLVRHIRKHTGEMPFACKMCQYKCKTRKKLVKHVRIHTGEKAFACKICKYTCTGRNKLIVHMRTHTGEKPYQCELCSLKFSHKSNLVTHMRTHTGEKPYTCELCTYKCAQNSSLVYHMATHTGDKPFACTKCPYKCSRKNLLTIHMRSHSGEKRRRQKRKIKDETAGANDTSHSVTERISS